MDPAHKILIYAVWFAFMSVGGIVDARIWGDKSKDPAWLQKYFDGFWLIALPAIVLINGHIGMVLAPLYASPYHFTLESLLVFAGMSVFWDLWFVRIEHGRIVSPVPRWLDWPVRIGFFTEAAIWRFHTVRVLVLLASVFVLF